MAGYRWIINGAVFIQARKGLRQANDQAQAVAMLT